MARKGKKELSAAEIYEQAKERIVSDLQNSVQHCNMPTYRFKVGDKVLYGAFADSVVAEILFDGKAYLLNCKTEKENAESLLRGAIWVDVRPVSANTENQTHLATRNPLKLNFLNSTLQSLLHYYFFSASIWNQITREAMFGARKIRNT